jgi:hypothetical protein
LAELIPIPDTVESITAEWISQAVSTRYPRSVAESIEIVDAHSGTTGRVQFRVQWRVQRNGESNAPKAIFGKLAPTDPIQRQMVAFTDMGRREARFYAEIASEVPVRVPGPIWSGWSEDDESQYFMLLEDLSQAGCSFPTSQEGATRQTIEGMIDTLATLHGYYWQSPRFSQDLDWIEPPMRSPIGPLLVEEGMKQFGDRMPPEFHALAALYIDHNEAVCDLLDTGPETLTHGDSHIGNTFLDDAEVGLLDWACICRAPGIRDVSYYLCNSVPTSVRRDRESALLARYLERLDASGGNAASSEDAWRQYRRLATCSWIAATATAGAGSRMQSIDVGLRAMQRATQAIIDLDTPGLLREELGL